MMQLYIWAADDRGCRAGESLIDDQAAERS
jgi:hypothetical protein